MSKTPRSVAGLAALALVLSSRPVAAQTADSTARRTSATATNVEAVRADAQARLIAWYGTPYAAEQDAPHGAGQVVDGVDLPPQDARGVTRRFQLFDRLIVTPPSGVRAGVGDSLWLVRRGPMLGTVQVVLPTGIAVVDGVSNGLRTARLVRVYDVVEAEQAVLPLPRVAPLDTAASPPSQARETRVAWIEGDPELPSLQRVVLLAAGADAGLHEGDRLELVGDGRRIPGGPLLPGTRAATVRVIRVTPQGTSARIESQQQPAITVGMTARSLPR